MAVYKEELAAKVPEAIKVTLPDGKVIEAESWRTTPHDIAKGIRYNSRESQKTGGSVS